MTNEARANPLCVSTHWSSPLAPARVCLDTRVYSLNQVSFGLDLVGDGSGYGHAITRSDESRTTATPLTPRSASATGARLLWGAGPGGTLPTRTRRGRHQVGTVCWSAGSAAARQAGVCPAGTESAGRFQTGTVWLIANYRDVASCRGRGEPPARLRWFAGNLLPGWRRVAACA